MNQEALTGHLRNLQLMIALRREVAELYQHDVVDDSAEKIDVVIRRFLVELAAAAQGE